jgi:hypothetical protein
VEDFDASVKALQEKEITVERSGVCRDDQRYLFIRDPDGNRVELCTPSGFSKELVRCAQMGLIPRGKLAKLDGFELEHATAATRSR